MKTPIINCISIFSKEYKSNERIEAIKSMLTLCFYAVVAVVVSSQVLVGLAECVVK